METITATKHATANVFAEVWHYLPTILNFVFSPTVAFLSWIGLTVLLRKTKPINNIFRLLRIQLYQGNDCDDIWILSAVLGVFCNILWLSVVVLEPGLTPQPGKRFSADDPVMPWSVKVFTTMIVSMTATELVFGMLGVGYATYRAYNPPLPRAEKQDNAAPGADKTD